MVYVLDTHILLWYFTGNKRLAKRFKDIIDKTRNEGGLLLIPTIVLAESLYLHEKGRVEFDFEKMFRLIEKEPEFEVIGFGVEVFEEVTRLKNIPELHDRIIAATAKFYGAEILTIDQRIT